MDDFEKNESVSKKTLWPYSRCIGSPSIQVNSNPLFATGAISYTIANKALAMLGMVIFPSNSVIQRFIWQDHVCSYVC